MDHLMSTDLGSDRDTAVVRLADQLLRFVLVVKRGMARFGGPNREGIEYPGYGLLAPPGPRRAAPHTAAGRGRLRRPVDGEPADRRADPPRPGGTAAGPGGRQGVDPGAHPGRGPRPPGQPAPPH